MPHCVILQVFLLVGACFSTWAAPLRSTSLPQERRCDRREQQSRDTNEHPASHHDDKMCIISSIPQASSPLVQEPKGTADVFSSVKHEGMKIAITDANLGHKIELFRRSVKSYTQYHEESTEPTEESSAEEKKQKLLPTSPHESFPLMDHTVGHGIENTEKEPSTSPENYAEQKVAPIQLRTDRPEPTQVTLGLSGYSSLPYSDIEEDKGTVQPLTKPQPLKQEGGWDVKTSKNQFDELKISRGISTEPSFSAHASVSQSPRNINPAVTALTTSHSYDGQTGGSTKEKKRVAEVNFFTATEQDKALVPGLLTLSSRLAELGDTWTEPVHLQGEEASVLPLLQEVGTEATMSSEDLPLIFEPFDDVTPSSSSALASELSVAMVPATGMLGETELEQTLSMDTDHSPHQSFPGPSDWPSPWQMSGAENSDTVSSSQMPISGPFSEADVERSERTERLQNPIVLSTSVDVLRLSPSATTQQVADIKSTHSAVLKPVSGLEELESQENEDEEDDYADESEEDEEESEEELTEVPVHSPTRPPYILIPPPPVWGQRNQGLIRSWVKLIREKAGYVSGMLAPVGIGIAGALLIVGALYGIRMIHRKRKNSLKHQRRKQPTEVRSGPDQAMLLADSSEDEF
ncbi:armadillo-like helical domain-containing protein 4 isoform X2 [Hemibagrus wyckioides]|uniref:armadillo-like helical domain-containing protein 4 isoform X2 n=1 Tax=Hemibagrus wyckioides TaxID=337641 RepID=UPI00266D4849|nr:armadillo-like helical domain-containing protein 4 isoform X2 [Hemibagrus wyckioides]